MSARLVKGNQMSIPISNGTVVAYGLVMSAGVAIKIRGARVTRFGVGQYDIIVEPGVDATAMFLTVVPDTLGAAVSVETADISDTVKRINLINNLTGFTQDHQFRFKLEKFPPFQS